MDKIVSKGETGSILERPDVRPSPKRCVPVSDLLLIEAIRARMDAGQSREGEGPPSEEDTPSPL